MPDTRQIFMSKNLLKGACLCPYNYMPYTICYREYEFVPITIYMPYTICYREHAFALITIYMPYTICYREYAFALITIYMPYTICYREHAFALITIYMAYTIICLAPNCSFHTCDSAALSSTNMFKKCVAKTGSGGQKCMKIDIK